LADAERELAHLRESERESRRHAEVLMRNTSQLGSRRSPREIAQATMDEVQRLNVRSSVLVLLRSERLSVLASTGLTRGAVERIEQATLADDVPVVAAMHTGRALRFTDPELLGRWVEVGEPQRNTPVELMVWPLRSADGSVLGALGVGVVHPEFLDAPLVDLLAALAEQVGLALGRATEFERRRAVEAELRVAAEQDRYQAQLADAMRAAEKPGQAEHIAIRLLGEHLQASRVHYVDFGEDDDLDVVTDDYLDGVRSTSGQGIGLYGPEIMAEVRAGRTVCVHDVGSERRLDAKWRRRAEVEGIRAYVIAPLMRRDRAVSALVVHQSTPRGWTRPEVLLIEETAERMGTTVERVLAASALTEREARYRSLFSSIDEGYCLCEILDGNGEGNDYRFIEVNPRFEELTGLTALTQHTARELFPDPSSGWYDAIGRVAFQGETFREEIHSERVGRWFDIYVAPVEPTGSGRFLIVMGDATQRHRAEDTLRQVAETASRARQRAELVAQVMSELEAIDRLEPLGDQLVRALVPDVADYAVLEVPGRSRPVMALTHHDTEIEEVLRELREEYRRPEEPTSLLQAARGHPRLIEQVTPDLLAQIAVDEPSMALLRQLAPRSHIAVPVDVSGESGALLLGVSNPERPLYTQEDFALAQEIAARTSVLFAGARVREDEHAIGVRLQQALLPESLLEHPAIQVAARYQTGSDLLYVGGDWYDTLELADDQVGVAVGDVVGHGLDAAAAMSRLRIALAALAPESDDAGNLLERLAEFASGANGVEFATAVCGFLDPASGAFRYASAGHPPILVVSPGGHTRWLDAGRSVPLGAVAAGAARPHATEQLASGDLLILYSDGLVERRAETITTGLSRLEEVAHELVDLPVEEVCGKLLERMTTYPRTDDDAVVLCLRYSPVTPESFERRIPATASQLALARAAVRSWLTGRRDSDSVQQRLLLAMGEALTNVVEHAYIGERGAMELSITSIPDGLEVVVEDHGRWREWPGDADRGRGLGVIGALSVELDRHTDAAGTRLRFRIPENEAAL
jgi:PAS domain S-box-containing protein